jgi:hypothetical protein
MVKRVAVLLAFTWTAGLIAGAALAADIKADTASTSGAPADALYRSVAIVTGTRMETRVLGFAQALGDVLVKLTGDQTILQDARFIAIAGHAGDYVERFSYRDRKEGKPYHDGQGTHDRPHDLTVVFDRTRIDALALSLGRAPWSGPRPRVVVFVGVDNVAFANGKGTKQTYMLASDGSADKSADMREAFAVAADRPAWRSRCRRALSSRLAVGPRRRWPMPSPPTLPPSRASMAAMSPSPAAWCSARRPWAGSPLGACSARAKPIDGASAG